MTYIEIIESYNEYYNEFKIHPISRLLDLCEQNDLSLYGSRDVLIDRLALYYSEKNKPSRLYLCMNSIKQMLSIT
jgi:hypothetical protein